MKRLIAILCFAMLAGLTFAQNPPAQRPCVTPEASQFDFWVGEWEANSPSSKDPKTMTLAGHNSITKVLDGCVIEENYKGSTTPLLGLSVSLYNPRTKQWQQTWVDNQGAYLDFTGGFADGKMVLQRSATKPDGTTFLQRMVWFNITADAFDWNWESSTDGGKTWQVNWPIKYKRSNSGARGKKADFI